MALSNYSGLKTSIANWLHRDDLTAVIPDFIELCESDIAKDVRAQDQDFSTTLTISSVDTSLPSMPLEILSFSITGSSEQVLQFKTALQMTELGQSETGKPKFFTVKGGNVSVYPEPDAPYIANITYTKRYDALVADTDTNYLLTHYPKLYLYGSLMQAHAFTENENVESYYAAFMDEVERVNNTEERLKFAQSKQLKLQQRLP